MVIITLEKRTLIVQLIDIYFLLIILNKHNLLSIWEVA